MSEQVDVGALHSFYRNISELVGVDAMMKVFDQYRGTQVVIPNHLYDRQLAAKHVAARYDGHNSRDLARLYGYSQRWVIKAVKESRTE